jgi:hypothetical protein
MGKRNSELIVHVRNVMVMKVAIDRTVSADFGFRA